MFEIAAMRKSGDKGKFPSIAGIGQQDQLADKTQFFKLKKVLIYSHHL
ncbi:MAG: hypothetical protein GQ546_00275 [Gammaproteobacteria bacterium]|nr:hypothetical protein [Gammaproteobacteria bacterium]